MDINLANEFIKQLKSIQYFHARDVFEDFVVTAALSMRVPIERNEEMNQQLTHHLQNLEKRYQKEDLPIFSRLLSLLTDCLMYSMDDYLGYIYQEIQSHNADLGQFFTPKDVSLLMAQASFMGQEKNIQAAIEEKGYLSLHDPAAGSGALLLGSVEVLKQLGVDYQKELLIDANDIARTPAYMCFIQMNLCGIPAIIRISDSLTQQVNDVCYTIGYCLQTERWAYHNKTPFEQLLMMVA